LYEKVNHFLLFSRLSHICDIISTPNNCP